MQTPERVLYFVFLILSLPPDTAEQPAEIVYVKCGDYLTGSCGILLSPEFPNNYPSNCRCTWEISTSPGTYVVIYFPSVNLEKHPSCYWDFVSIHDGPPGSSMTGKICDPGSYTFYASSNIMTVEFKSDGSVENKGFQAIYYTQTFYSIVTSTTEFPYITSPTTTVTSTTAFPYTTSPTTTGTSTTVANPRCGGHMTRNWGSFTSPFYPSSYSSNTLCTWEIIPQQYSNIYITIYIESLESNSNCAFDYVEVNEGNIGSNVLAKICEPGMYSYSISSNRMNIVFRSDGSVQGVGFEAQFHTYYDRATTSTTSNPGFPATTSTTSNPGFPATTSTTSNPGFPVRYTNCGENLTESSGQITSPMYPQNYPTNCWCIWQIIAPSNKTVEINFNTVKLEYHPTCDYDYVKVYNGDQEFGKICGNETRLYYGSSNLMRIEFKSDGSVEGSGFMASYNFVNPINIFAPS